jgi:hypothetical protein
VFISIGLPASLRKPRSKGACWRALAASIFKLGGSLMRGLPIAVGIIAALYVADQLYAQGKYTYALQHMVTQMRHSFEV